MRPQLMITAVLLAANAVSAQVTTSVDMTDDSQWTIVQDSDAAATFGFDYEPYGIPPAPGSDDGLGVRLEANMQDPADVATISITPNNLSFSGRYRVHVDVWLNYYADPDKNGTTEFGGLFVGFDPTGSPLNGAGLLGSTDGDASVDYRLYGDGEELALDSSQYSVDSQNHNDPIFTEAFPANEVPAEQTDDFDPPNEFDVTFEGSLGFSWHTFTADVDTNAGEAVFFIDDVEIGFVTPESNGGRIDGSIALTYSDLFASVSPVAEFAFGVFDNLRIETFDQPIPGDIDADGSLTSADIDLLSSALRDGVTDPMFDVNGDGQVSSEDHGFLIREQFGTWIGDANLDGEFNSGDFVTAFTAGKYENGETANWSEGDWNADGQFDTSDFVTAFSEGGYENGPRPATVPEPSGLLLVLCALATIVPLARWQQ